MNTVLVIIVLVITVPFLPAVVKRAWREETLHVQAKRRTQLPTATVTSAKTSPSQGRRRKPKLPDGDPLSDDDLAEMEGMFGASGTHPEDYK